MNALRWLPALIGSVLVGFGAGRALAQPSASASSVRQLGVDLVRVIESYEQLEGTLAVGARRDGYRRCVEREAEGRTMWWFVQRAEEDSRFERAWREVNVALPPGPLPEFDGNVMGGMAPFGATEGIEYWSPVPLAPEIKALAESWCGLQRSLGSASANVDEVVSRARALSEDRAGHDVVSEVRRRAPPMDGGCAIDRSTPSEDQRARAAELRELLDRRVRAYAVVWNRLLQERRAPSYGVQHSGCPAP